MLDRNRGYWHSAELLTAARMAEAGWVVSVPLIPVRYDLIGDYAGRLIRVQVKRAKWRTQRMKPAGKGDRACWTVTMTKHRGRPGKDRYHERITPEECDYLAVMCTPEDIYFIPIATIVNPDTGGVIKCFQIKPPDPENGRADAKTSGDRYEPYRNNFLPVS